MLRGHRWGGRGRSGSHTSVVCGTAVRGAVCLMSGSIFFFWHSVQFLRRCGKGVCRVVAVAKMDLVRRVACRWRLRSGQCTVRLFSELGTMAVNEQCGW